MQVIVIESEAFYKLLEESVKRIEANRSKQSDSHIPLVGSDWIPLSEAQILLPYKSKTSWQKLRDSGEIPFSKTGRKILYSRQSILNFIKKNQIK